METKREQFPRDSGTPRGNIRQLDACVEVALWWQRLRETSNDTFLPLYFDRHRHLVLMGGGGSGKSVFAARKIDERCATEAGHRILVVRKVGKTLRDSCFQLLKRTATKYYKDAVDYIPKGRSSDMYIRFKNGSEILFAGLDDADKLKSIDGISGIWIEEASEISREDFNQLDIRLRDEPIEYQQIILSFNPISMTHWLKERFFDAKDPYRRVLTHRSNYKDNRFCSEAERITLEAFEHTDPYYYQVYCLGNWGVLGKTVFDKAILTSRLTALVKPAETGAMQYRYDGLRLTDWRFAAESGGELLVWKMPERGHPYVIGADTAGEGSDWFVAQVIDNASGEQVARYRTQTDESIFARDIFALGMWYNTALIGVETNFGTHPVKELERLRYPKLYLREREDTITHRIQMSLGFMTTKLTRAVMISNLKDIVREHAELLHDRQTIEEMLTFVKNPQTGKPEAEAGAHDDCVLALAITYYIRDQQTTRITGAEAAKKAKWEADMWEDYYAASPEEQRVLVEKWGNPL